MASEGEPESKKIRSSEPDLKVIIGSDEAEKEEAGADGEDDAEQKPRVVTKWYHSPSLAAKSKYVDALLAAPMKESESRTITFPDISPDTWDLMMKFVDDPLAIRSMKPEDVVQVAKLYDKYEFSGGRSLCDTILVEYFKSVFKETFVTRTNKVVPDVDFIVASVVLAHEANLNDAFGEGMGFIWKMLVWTLAPVGRTAFSQEHMKLLAPLLEETDKGLFERGLKNHYNLKSDTFPKEFVNNCSNWLEHDTLNRFISHIRLSGSTCKADGDYVGRLQECEFRARDGRNVRWNSVLMRPLITCRTTEEGWVVILETIPPLDEEGDPDYDSIVETVIFKAPHSGNMTLPPSNGWVSAHPDARGELKITYILREGEVEVC
mmetsp:Transcript_14939/g.35647  ORF Transcript_14939/g.35647 Transcript_14939/m.35647 type:complete len:377 (+) Transcript_14939:127-1257(+)|eukprot:CAMPEP_0185811672 /NCGR_PEP_ID=MMETSP1322-20130828/8361_1 /TAXON_ID=265543 /ORGANISM="Minutocellus polymorphus, Strain RCC2270" /LENGTH=376 /DNA_ID=CAMNT_0028508141 /DNA_START=67 /DNA_END=1197 /DNA_ORIENTATION=-